MATIDISISDRLPGAEDPLALAISFGEGATDALVQTLDNMREWAAQITDEHGSWNVRMFGITTNSDGIYSIDSRRVLDDEDFENYSPEPELIPLDAIRRIHVW